MPGIYGQHSDQDWQDRAKLLETCHKKGFVKRREAATKHSEMLSWLKSKEIGLGHVHANFIILYLQLRAK
ncbi:DUF4287 domain-containing protein [Candidatus Bathyarchaeota archaeon]|nr:MAG: DUF4287 domain-containing protein [Candidatus Bathyarchaeota archaeon]